VETIELLVTSSSFNIDDKYLKLVWICNFYKRLILKLRGQEVITCSQILNRTLTIISCGQIKLWIMTMPNCAINMNVQANHTKILRARWLIHFFTSRVVCARIRWFGKDHWYIVIPSNVDRFVCNVYEINFAHALSGVSPLEWFAAIHLYSLIVV